MIESNPLVSLETLLVPVSFCQKPGLSFFCSRDIDVFELHKFER